MRWMVAVFQHILYLTTTTFQTLDLNFKSMWKIILVHVDVPFRCLSMPLIIFVDSVLHYAVSFASGWEFVFCRAPGWWLKGVITKPEISQFSGIHISIQFRSPVWLNCKDCFELEVFEALNEVGKWIRGGIGTWALFYWGSGGWRIRVSTSAPVGDPDPYLWVYILSKLKPRSVWVIRHRWPGSTGQVPVKIQVLVI